MATCILYPNGTGALNGIPSVVGAGSHWEAMDEAAPDDDTTKVVNNSGTNNWYFDLYTLTNPPTSITISQIVVSFRGKMSNYVWGQPASYMRSYIRTNNTNYSSSDVTLGDSWSTSSKTYETNPSTDAAWTESELTALQAGVGLQGSGGSPASVCHATIVNVKVTYTSAVFVPGVSTSPANDISMTKATLNGNLTDMGGADECECWFQWGTTTGYGFTTPVEYKTSSSPFAYGLSGLTPDTTYNFRACAKNSAGTSYGSNRSFTTKPRQIEYYVKDDNGRPIRKAQGETYRQDTGALLETQWSDNNGKLLFTDCPNDTAIDLKVKWSNKVSWVKSILEVI